ncbi:AAA family ATPase [Aliarcobacter butzleri]|uniref:AAA family ATPase n=1 Tax=Aliarcobacter butzleri TaxID=28197 RepID=UPI002B24CDC2|nr:AAA family ATPase [Aliarcobacter butzleri]
MKLNKLQINGFNILQDEFLIDFDKASNLSILIGKNGSGKSSILEAVGIIFKSLYKGSNTPFTFVIDYHLGDKHIGIQNIEEFTIRINADVYQIGEFKYLRETQGLDIFPDNIIAYYSGSNERLKKIFNFGKYLESPFLYLEDKHFKFILSSLISSNLDRHTEFLRENFQIEKNDSFQMKLKVKLFDKKLIEEIHPLDQYFKIYLRELLNIQDLLIITKQNLYQADSENIENILKSIEKIEIAIGASDLLRYCMRVPYRFKNGLFEFLIDFEESNNFIYEIGNEVNLFKNFLFLSSKGMLKDVETSFTKESDIVNHAALSEGEKQLITVVGIKELTTLEENLFLLDEPDTYLHPSWQNKLINQLNDKNEDYTLMTTHSVNILKNISKKHIFILKNIDNIIEIYEPPKSTFGRDVNSILNEVMGVDERNSEVDKLLDEYFAIISEKDFEKAEQKKNEILKLAQEHNEEFFSVDEPEFIRANAIIERMKVLGR